ncbi:unnamed protein product [Somion occarium]|uniref:DUF4336 domain-containing protein n=1 Tax=Somion occarium TaxID=3059160 RepID=A0ABP1DNT7_9APHY
MPPSNAENEIIIREVVKDVWIFSRPFNLFNRLPVGGRSTAIKLKNGDVWLIASTPLTSSTRSKLAELGVVRYIIAPNAFHNLFLKSYKDAYPEAKVIGPEELNEKKRAEGWQLDEVFNTSVPDPKLGFEDEIEHCFFVGYKNKDVAYHHKASKTVVAADLLFNLPATEQYSQTQNKPSFPIINSWSANSWVMRMFVWLKEGDFAEMQWSARKVGTWDFDRWIPCHGDVIETNAKQVFKEAYRRYF